MGTLLCPQFSLKKYIVEGLEEKLFDCFLDQSSLLGHLVYISGDSIYYHYSYVLKINVRFFSLKIWEFLSIKYMLNLC